METLVSACYVGRTLGGFDFARDFLFELDGEVDVFVDMFNRWEANTELNGSGLGAFLYGGASRDAVIHFNSGTTVRDGFVVSDPVPGQLELRARRLRLNGAAGIEMTGDIGFGVVPVPADERTVTNDAQTRSPLPSLLEALSKLGLIRR